MPRELAYRSSDALKRRFRRDYFAAGIFAPDASAGAEIRWHRQNELVFEA